MKNINEILNELRETGKTFHVSFEKANGEHREMDARFGVTKHLKGGKATYNANPDNVGVYESIRDSHGRFADGAYKCFNINRVKSIKVDGEIHKFQ